MATFDVSQTGLNFARKPLLVFNEVFDRLLDDPGARSTFRACETVHPLQRAMIHENSCGFFADRHRSRIARTAAAAKQRRAHVLDLRPLAGGAGFAAASARRTTHAAVGMLNVNVQLVLAIRASARDHFGLQPKHAAPGFEWKNFGQGLSCLLPTYSRARPLPKPEAAAPKV